MSNVFIPNALAINVAADRIDEATVELLNTGWRIFGIGPARGHRFAERTIIAIPKAVDLVNVDVNRRRIEFAYGVRNEQET